ncbi:unnamed protein product [Calicophoron daubneyi]|uniref:RUN domain-containing protein n=1 Tax=Calicophoron daubneyi TaxID=300641 RepID=A0AAV2TA29_CALDB
MLFLLYPGWGQDHPGGFDSPYNPWRMQAERANLLSVARLVVRDVIQYASGKQRIFIDNYNFSQSSDDSTDSAVQAVYRLLAVIEHCLCHGLRRDLPVTELPPSSRTSRLSSSKDVILNSSSVLRRAKDQVVLKASSLITPPSEPNPWPVLLHIEQLIPALEEMSKSILTMSTVRTGLGRSRVWICQALMRKQLANYLQRLIDEVDEPITGTQKSDLNADEHPAVLDGLQPSSFYTSEAMLINDEGVVFVGLLVGLSSIDFCFVLKDNLKELDCGVRFVVAVCRVSSFCCVLTPRSVITT